MTPPPRTPGLAFVVFTLLLDVLGVGLMIPILPGFVASFYGGDISAGAIGFGWVMATFSLSVFICSPLQGALSDQFGRRPLLLVSLVGSAASYLLLAFAPSMAWVFVAQLANGASGASVPVCSAYIADVTPVSERSKSFGIIGAIFGLGLVMGPALGGLLGSFGLRVPFLVAAGLAGLNLAYGIFVLPESLAPEHRRPFDWRGANPLASLGLLVSTPRLLGLTVVLTFTNLALQCMRSVWVLHNTWRFGWGTWENGASLALVGILGATVQGGLMRWCLRRFGEGPTILCALGLGVVADLVFAWASAGWMMYAGLPLVALSNMAVPAAQGLTSGEVGPSQQGRMQGAIASLTTVCALAGTLTSTRLFSHFTAAPRVHPLPGAPFLLGAALFVVALGCALASLRPPAAGRTELIPE